MYSIKKESLTQLRELLEDTIEYYCDENMISGELAWTITGVFAEAKIHEIKGHTL